MLRFEYCPPFAVSNGAVPGVRPLVETQSLQAALSNLQSRPDSSLSISVLVTDGDVSTLIPVTLPYSALAGTQVNDARQIIESYAERRFRLMPVQRTAIASA